MNLVKPLEHYHLQELAETVVAVVVLVVLLVAVKPYSVLVVQHSLDELMN
jgi:hypothetical protein